MHRILSSTARRALPVLSVAALALQVVAQVPGSWSGVQVLEPSMVSSSPPEIPVVACDPAGHAVSAWTSPSMGVAFAERYPGGDWSTATSIHPSAVTGFSPQIAIGSSGVVAATWIVPGQETIPPKLLVSVRPVGGAFSAPIPIVTGAYVFDSKLGVVAKGGSAGGVTG